MEHPLPNLLADTPLRTEWFQQKGLGECMRKPKWRFGWCVYKPKNAG